MRVRPKNREDEYTSPINVNNQLYYCGIPFRLDSYNGCGHGCKYCITPETPVLMADLSQKPIADVKIGDRVVGFDEYAINNQRHLRVATVLAKLSHKAINLWRIITPSGDLFSTGDHEWLHSRGGSWTQPQYFTKQGTSLRHLFNPITTTETDLYRYGYIAGFFDAEGSMRYTPGQKTYYSPSTPYFTIGQAENNLEALERVTKYLTEFGLERLSITIERSNRSQQTTAQPFYVIQMSDLDRVRRIYEFLHQRPEEELEFQRGWLAGFFDGEGSCTKLGTGGAIFLCNQSSIFKLRLERYATSFNFRLSSNEYDNTGRYLLGGTPEAMRFISLTNPAIGRKRNAWEGNTRWGKETRIEAAEQVRGEFEVCDIETDSHTFIAGGYASHNCFVRAAELTSAARKNRGDTLLIADEASVKRMLVTALDSSDTRANVAIEWLRHRVPVHWGGMSDPFQPCERKYKITRQWMKYFSWYEYPVIMSTKGTMMIEPEYLELLKEGKYGMQITLLTDNDGLLKKIEPGAPLASERLKALEVLAENGIWTAVRIQPMVPDSIIEWEAPRFIERLAKIGVKHILAEGYKVPVRNPEGMKAMFDVFPEAWKAYQYHETKTEGFEYLLPTWRKWKYVKILVEACHANGLTYGAADNDLRDMGDAVCCCGCDFIPGFENFWRYQASQAAKIAKEKGWVHLDDMQQFWTGGDRGFSVHNDLIRFGHKAEFGNIQATPKWAVDFMWNRGGAMSPGCMFSMKKAHLNGRLVYKRTDPVSVLEAEQKEQTVMF